VGAHRQGEAPVRRLRGPGVQRGQRRVRHPGHRTGARPGRRPPGRRVPYGRRSA
jgi:hypothetical protein